MRLAWVGFHAEALPALDAMLSAGAPIGGVLTLTSTLAAARSGGGDFRPVCERHKVPLHYVSDINGPDAQKVLRALEPDVVFVIGWHQIVRAETLCIARVGMIGAHASLLPHNRGSAPINWAIINGETRTGNTLFWLTESVDAGHIIDQVEFPITPYDTCATLYQHVASSNREMLLRVVPRLIAGERPNRPQPPTSEPTLRRRRPADGLVDWTLPSRNVYDFVRALAKPYPGAFSPLEGRTWKIWDAAQPPATEVGAQSGEVIGPVVSPCAEACGQLVACGRGTLILLELQADDGTILKGRGLSDQSWTGKRFGHG
jgi:methionyl-tRNA formyltransferase